MSSSAAAHPRIVPAVADHAETPRPAPDAGPLTDTKDTAEPPPAVTTRMPEPRRIPTKEREKILATPLFMLDVVVVS